MAAPVVKVVGGLAATAASYLVSNPEKVANLFSQVRDTLQKGDRKKLEAELAQLTSEFDVLRGNLDAARSEAAALARRADELRVAMYRRVVAAVILGAALGVAATLAAQRLL